MKAVYCPMRTSSNTILHASKPDSFKELGCDSISVCRHNSFVRSLVVIFIALVIIGALGTLKWQRTHRDNLVVTCLDVGHGQAILAQLPGGDNILFDAGSLYNRNIGKRG